MKKYIAIIICAVIVLGCFASCSKKPDDVSGYPAVTEKDGGVIRDEAGNLIVYVTDINGKIEKGEDGEKVTSPVALEHPIVVGRRVEGPTYALNIPDGWSDKLTSADLDITRDGTKDNLRLSHIKDSSLSEVLKDRQSVINIAKTNFPAAENGNKSITFGDGIQAQYMYVWVDDTGVREEDENGDLTVISSFAGLIVFEHAGDVYSCFLSSNTNMNEDIDEITDILGTIEFFK